MTQLEIYIYISLRGATFGGSPCPYEWSVISETNTNLENLLLNYPSCDLKMIRSSIQHETPTDNPIPDDIPFTPAIPTVIFNTVDCYAEAYVYID